MLAISFKNHYKSLAIFLKHRSWFFKEIASSLYERISAQDVSTTPPRRLQDASKTAQDASKTPQDASKTPPRRVYQRPRRLYDASGRPQDASRRLQDASKTAQDASKAGQIRLTTLPRLVKTYQGASQRFQDAFRRSTTDVLIDFYLDSNRKFMEIALG